MIKNQKIQNEPVSDFVLGIYFPLLFWISIFGFRILRRARVIARSVANILY